MKRRFESFLLKCEPSNPTPVLKSFAAGVLISGQPSQLPSPCQSSCSYNLTIKGPAFQCQDVPTTTNYSLTNPNVSVIGWDGYIYEAIEHYDESVGAEGRFSGIYRYDDILAVRRRPRTSWDANAQAIQADPPKQLNCSAVVGVYDVAISFQDSQRTIKPLLRSQGSAWTQDNPIEMAYLRYFLNLTDNSTGTIVDPYAADKAKLPERFLITQSYSLKEAATSPLLGTVTYSKCFKPYSRVSAFTDTILSGGRQSWPWDGDQQSHSGDRNFFHEY